jgi:uncharacterized protein
MLSVLGIGVAIYGAICAYVFVRQRALIYHPTPVGSSWVGEAVSLPVAGAVLRLWVIGRPTRAAVLYFGGNAESVVDNAIELAAAIPDRTCVLVNYRGYGGSTGMPSEAVLVADALAVFDWLKLKHDDIAAVGRSLGSGVALQLAVARPVTRLVLVTPFDSLVCLGNALLPWLPMSLLMTDRFESVRYAPRVACPTRILIAGDDQVIPPLHARRLVAAFVPGRVSVLEVPGAAHNDIQLWPRYYQQIGAFVAVT